MGIILACVGCEAPQRSRPIAGDGPKQDTTAVAKPAKEVAKAPARQALTASSNPTTKDGRGEPSLDDIFRPAAWVYIDGQPGRFIEADGNPEAFWTVNGPVSSAPTFRVEAYAPLLGTPKNFNCVIKSVEPIDGADIVYSFAADAGSFELGRTYSLLKPGENFTVRNNGTGDLVTEIPTLLPGKYMIAAGVKNTDSGKEGLAMTRFTVGEGH